MKKLYFLILLTFFISVSGFAKNYQNMAGHMGGRISKTSPTYFHIGKNKISFISEGAKIIGNLYVPKNYTKGDQLPAIVIIRPKGSVKEQTQSIYAKKLTKKGFVTLVIDHRTYGESEGYPRHYENPYMKVEDAKNAISYILSLNIVDKDNIGVLGICNGSAFAAAASIYDRNVKAFASVSAIFDMRSQIMNGKAGDKKNFLKIMKKSAVARQKYFETGKVEYVAQMPPVNKKSNQLRKEAWDYYMTSRGRVSNWGKNRMVTFSMDTRRSFDITDQISLLTPTPYLAIAGTKALTLPYSELAYKRAKGKKEIFRIKGATHMDLYDINKYVNQAVSKLNTFYTKYLHKK